MRNLRPSIFAVFAILLALPASGLTLAFPGNNLATMALVYGKLAHKKVSLSDESTKDITIVTVTGDTELTEAQAVKFLEAAFYLKGIEVVPAGGDSVVLTPYAKFKEPDPTIRRIIRPKKVPEN